MGKFKNFTKSNENIQLDTPPQRVVVLGYPAYDTLKVLGLEDSIVAAPKKAQPGYIGGIKEDVKDVESLHEPNLDVIKEANPDLIIGTGRAADSIPELEKIAPVFKYAAETYSYWNSFREINTELAKIFEKEDEVKQLIDQLDQHTKDVRDFNKDNPDRTLVLMLSEGNLKAFDKESRFSLIYEELGFNPVNEDFKAKAHGEEITYDQLEEIDPDRLFVIDRTAAITDDENKGMLVHSEIENTTAAKNNKLHVLTADLWYLGGGGLDSTSLQVQEVKQAIGQQSL